MKGQRIRYTEQELAWVKENCKLSRREMAERFAEKFDRTDVTEIHLKGLCTRNNWKGEPEWRQRSRGKSLVFTPDQVQWMKDNASLPRTEVLDEFLKAFPGSGITAEQIVSYRKRNGIRTGRSGRYAKGHEPWSKGRKLESSPNSKRHQFKPGQKPKNTMPIGTERIRYDGYVEIKIDQQNPHTGAQGFFVMKHKHLWEQANGPIPEGHVLKSQDGDRTNCDPSNWAPIPRSLLARLGAKSGRDYDNAPDELKPTIMAIAKLEQAARDAAGRKTKTTE